MAATIQCKRTDRCHSRCTKTCYLMEVCTHTMTASVDRSNSRPQHWDQLYVQYVNYNAPEDTKTLQHLLAYGKCCHTQTEDITVSSLPAERCGDTADRPSTATWPQPETSSPQRAATQVSMLARANPLRGTGKRNAELGDCQCRRSRSRHA